MHPVPRLLTVEVGVALNRLSVVESNDKAQVVGNCPGAVLLLTIEDIHLPVPALILAQVEHLKGLAAGYVQQALAADLNGEAGEVTANPASARLLRHRHGGPGATEEVGDKVAFVG